MALDDFLNRLEALSLHAQQSFDAVIDQDSLESARVELLGAKKGQLREVQKGLGGVDKADKPTAGQRFNEVKKTIEAAWEAAQQRIRNSQSQVSGEKDAHFDVTLPGKVIHRGHYHPITQTIRAMKEIMGRLGFSAVEGPEVEDDWHNFEALNIPPTHPARDPLENFYLATARSHAVDDSVISKQPPGKGESGNNPDSSAMLLRSQTSTVQIRVMENQPPPVRIVSLGRVYRPDTADATHYPMFFQIEGLLIDQGVTMADLKSILRLFYQSYFRGVGNSTSDQVRIRFRTSFFPFTEPSVEVDMNWNSGWMEMGGAGMVDPNVLRAVGYDPDVVSGFAFGLGVERICMRQHGITDIRDLYQNDIRFLEQF